MRRGLAAAEPGAAVLSAALAKAGIMESSNGSESMIPAPRRKVRRDNPRWIEMCTEGCFIHLSFVQEHLALDDLMYDCAHRITRFPCARQYLHNLGPVRKLDGRAGGIDRKLLDQIPRQLFVIGKQ